jgi:Ni,Fe-hydrogenase III large subunit
VGEAQCSLLTEYVKQLNARLTGHRFLRGINAVGGVRRGLAPRLQEEFLDALDYIGREAKVLTDLILSTKSHLDRLVTTGILPEKLAADYGAVGPVARGSGLPWDMRKDHPYAAYGELAFNVPVYHYGDALARMRVRMDEIPESIDLIREALNRLASAGEDLVTPLPQIPSGRQATGWAESPRGGLVVFVETGGGNTLRRCKVRSPSFCNWYLFQATVERTMMMDWPINERSFELTHAGCDL